MTRKKRIVAFSIILSLLILLVVGFFIYTADYYRATEEAWEVINDESETVIVTKYEYGYEFSPGEADIGIIFYPGAKVQCEAYAPLLYKLAEKGCHCFLIEMPHNMAFLDIDAANVIKEKHPEIATWYICGHSLGGAMAATYVERYPANCEGLILLAAYSTKDLSSSELKVVSIYGSEDGVLNLSHYEENKKNLPQSFTEYIIEGGNHASFAYYGAQKGDGAATISREEQINETVTVIADYINDK